MQTDKIDKGTLAICKNFMHNNCARDDCKFVHDTSICFHFWKYQRCKFDTSCKKKHMQIYQSTNNMSTHKENKKNKKKIRNTESFDPIDKNVTDMRIVTHLSNNNDKFNEILTTKDVIVVPDLFIDDPNVSYEKLVYEIQNCGIETNQLLKLWHGDTHLIADDHLNWKTKCPTFNYVISKIQNYFNIDIKSTRFNWYKTSDQFKPTHHDAAAIKPHIAKIQNFTLAVSFGETRDAVFEKKDKSGSKTFITLPQKNGSIYAFCNDTNIIWKHGILQGDPSIQQSTQGRISLIMWAWINQ